MNRRRVAHTKDEWASAKQTLKLADDQFNSILKLDNVNLAQFDRMVQIAKAYQFYRITKLEYRLLPFADTYQTSGLDGAGNALPHSSLPYAYTLINKGENLTVNSFNALRDAGAKPVRFDDRTVKVQWKPTVNILTRDSDATPPSYNFALTRTSPWLSTNDVAGQNPVTWTASTVPHMGLLYGVEQDFVSHPIDNPDYENSYGVEITAHFQFKKPLNFPGSGKAEEVSAISKDMTPQ